MSLRNERAAGAGLAAYRRNTCPQCREWLVAPDSSEFLDAGCVRHLWSCEACGCQFDTTVNFPGPSAALCASSAAVGKSRHMSVPLAGSPG